MQLERELAAEALGEPFLGAAPYQGAGYTKARAWRVRTGSGRAFLKEAFDEGGLRMLRHEALVYGHVTGPFLPEFIGFADAGDRACLALELLTDVDWPPPYPDDVSPLFETLELMAGLPVPPQLPAITSGERLWPLVARNPEPLLRLGVCSQGWLEQSLDLLVEAESRASGEGDALVHRDVYSGNVCFAERGAILVDWAAAGRGNPAIDLAFALLSVRVEGGRPPPIAFPEEAAFAAGLAGHFALEAPAPLPDWAEPGSTLRAHQRRDLLHALRWVSDVLELGPLR